MSENEESQEQIALPPLAKPWERMKDETDKAFTAFCQYLRLPKRGANPRRVVEDLAKQEGKKAPNYQNRWFKEFKWEERAAAWDAYHAQYPQLVAEMQDRREFADTLRRLGRKLLDKGEEIIDAVDVYGAKPDDGKKFIAQGITMLREAQSIEDPTVKRNELLGKIRELARGIAEGVASARGGESGRPGIGGVGSGVGVAPDSGEQALEAEFSTLPETPGPVCEGYPGADVVG